jgi:hypothetical protein
MRPIRYVNANRWGTISSISSEVIVRMNIEASEEIILKLGGISAEERAAYQTWVGTGGVSVMIMMMKRLANGAAGAVTGNIRVDIKKELRSSLQFNIRLPSRSTLHFTEFIGSS